MKKSLFIPTIFYTLFFATPAFAFKIGFVPHLFLYYLFMTPIIASIIICYSKKKEKPNKPIRQILKIFVTIITTIVTTFAILILAFISYATKLENLFYIITIIILYRFIFCNNGYITKYAEQIIQTTTATLSILATLNSLKDIEYSVFTAVASFLSFLTYSFYLPEHFSANSKLKTYLFRITPICVNCYKFAILCTYSLVLSDIKTCCCEH